MKGLIAAATIIWAVGVVAIAGAQPYLTVARARRAIEVVQTEERGPSTTPIGTRGVEWHIAACHRHKPNVIDCRIYERGLIETEDGEIPWLYSTDRATLKHGRIDVSFVNRP